MGTNRNEPSSSAMAASVGFTLLLPLPRFPFCDRLAVRVTVRAPCPPAAVGLPTPSLYCVSLARLRGGGAGAVDASEGGADKPLVNGSSVTALSSSSVSWMMTDEVEDPLKREFAVVREAIRVEGARWGGGAGAGRAA